MNKVLGLDIGTNSIGWALIDSDNHKVLKAGARIFIQMPVPRTKRRSLRRMQTRVAIQTGYKLLELAQVNKRKSTLLKKTFPILITTALLLCLVVTIVLAVLQDWQYWLNISVAFFIAFLSLSKK